MLNILPFIKYSVDISDIKFMLAFLSAEKYNEKINLQLNVAMLYNSLEHDG
jgi:hypothetical protein